MKSKNPLPHPLHITTACLTAVLVGCAWVPDHLHNDANAKVAAKAEAEMAVYSKNAPAMYTAMNANIERFKIEEEFVTSELATNVSTALLTKLPTMSWQEFKERNAKQRDEVRKFADTVAREAKTYEKETAELTEALKQAKKGVTAAKANLTKAKKDLAAWNKTVAFLKHGFSSLPDNLAKITKATTLSELQKITSEAGEQKIKFKNAENKEEEATVAAVLKGQVSNIADQIIQKDKTAAGAKPLFPDAPGIGVVIMNLSVELAEAKQRAAEEKLGQLEARAQLFEDAFAEMSIAGELLNDAARRADLLSVGNPGGFAFSGISSEWLGVKMMKKDLAAGWDAAAGQPAPQSDAPPFFSGTQEKFANATGAKLRDAENNVFERLITLRQQAVAESIVTRNQSKFVLAVERLKHRNSVADSVIADSAHRALIQNTLTGLKAYHDGGFTKEDAAKLIELGQAVGIGVIAKKTN